MTASLDPNGIPSHALRIWASAGNIYVAIPVSSGGHYITSYPFDSRGICLALELLGQHRRDYDYALTPSDGICKPSNLLGTQNQRDTMELLFKQARLIK